jgi:hypothetical protein
MEPKYFIWVRDNSVYSVDTRINALYTLLAVAIEPGQPVPSAVEIGKEFYA